NHLGVPLTLSRLRARHEAAVIEMGMNHPGEIRVLASLARPHVAIITNVALAHTEGVGGIEDVRKAKLEIAEGLGPDDTLIVDGDDARLVAAAQGFRARVVRTGWAEHCEVRVVTIDAAGSGTAALLSDGSHLHVALPGAHNVKNALAALAAAEACGVP